MKIQLEKINEAAVRIKDVSRHTDLQLSSRLSEKYQCSVYLKREDQQEIRSFKIRGAYNKIASLSVDEQSRGIVSASAGNHAQGVAYACKQLKITCTIFMPTVTPKQKVNKVKQFGGDYVSVMLVGKTFDDASAAAHTFCNSHGAVYVPPFDDEEVIAGQATIAKEIFEEMGESLDYVFVAIGGGGLVSGVGSYFKQVKQDVSVVGVESSSQASMLSSIKAKEIKTLAEVGTFADGTAVKTPGSLTFAITQEVVDEIVLGDDGEIASNMIDLYQLEGIIVEPSGALSLSGLERKKAEIVGKNVVCILCGGNNDILRYPEIMERSLVYKGLKHYFIIQFAQNPGQLKRFLNEALGPDDDIVCFEYMKKNNKEEGPAFVGVELSCQQDLEPLLGRMNSIGMHYEIVESDSMLYKYLV